MRKTTVLIADDHTLVCCLLADMLGGQEGIAVVGQAASGLEAIDKTRELRPDVVLMDLRMPGTDGIAATRTIAQEMPSTAILMLTMSDEDKDLLAAMKAGARGYLLKNVEPPDLIRSIQSITGGHAVIHPSLAIKLVAEAKDSSGEDTELSAVCACGITEREEEILGHLAQGETNKEIARALRITETTVKSHVHSILTKLHFTNRVQAAKWALEHGLAGQLENR